jgi:hypothetical protein
MASACVLKTTTNCGKNRSEVSTREERGFLFCFSLLPHLIRILRVLFLGFLEGISCVRQKYIIFNKKTVGGKEFGCRSTAKSLIALSASADITVIRRL